MTGKIGRYFVAVTLPETVKNSIEHIQKALVSDRNNYRWVHKERLHLTLIFCGEQTESNILKFADNLVERVKHIPSFKFTLGKLGAFPSLHRPKVIWVGIEIGGSALIDLQRTIAITFAQSNLPLDLDSQNFHPHITLARAKKKNDFEYLQLLEYPDQRFTQEYIHVQHIQLIESKLSRDGPEYKCVKTFNLGG